MWIIFLTAEEIIVGWRIKNLFMKYNCANHIWNLEYPMDCV